MNADALDPVLLHNVVNDLGWRELRPLQQAAIEPLLAGDDALLIAPTAAGKTEAAAFPLLSRAAREKWQGTSVLYLCPLKALLNNLEPRLARYSGWLGRRAELWHGDTGSAARKKILWQRPDILLSTPESLEAMLVSAIVDHRQFFEGLRVVVVDEVHAFAGDDRGWHLIAILERLTHLLGRRLQRVGLSATVGNPDELLSWLQGSSLGKHPARVVAPDLASNPAGLPQLVTDSATEAGSSLEVTDETLASAGSARPAPAEIELDYVGSLDNAATVITGLHAGQKRLVFCESRQAVEVLGQLLRNREVTTFLSHASLSVDERRRSEQAFAEARDCVIVSTSTLELGIDVGDLDRVIQIDSPGTVASFLQRLGRTGRRPGTTRSTLFLATDRSTLIQASALLCLWGRGFVEPITAPPEPRHIVAQQILAVALQQGRVGNNDWHDWWNGLEPFGSSADVILRSLVDNGYLDSDEGMLFIGPAAELAFGRRHFMEMTAVFTGAPEFTVLSGRTEIGRIDPRLLVEEVKGERRLLLGGRSWRVSYIDWRRRRCFVEPADSGGKARWTGFGFTGLSYELTQSMRDVLLGADPPVRMSKRAQHALAEERERREDLVHPGGSLIVRLDGGDVRWWTWAGFRANATLVASLGEVVDPMYRFDDRHIRLRGDVTPSTWREAVSDARTRLSLPDINEKSLVGLKFSDALPKRLAMATLAARLADFVGAEAVLAQATRFYTRPPALE